MMRRKLLEGLMVLTIAVINLQIIQAQDKNELVNKLIGLTAGYHPSVMEQQMAERSVDAEKYRAEERRSYAEFLTGALKANDRLTAEQKAFARKNLDRLIDRVAFEILVIQSRNTDTAKWVRESLRNNYAIKFTPTELNALADYFAKDEGQRALNYIATSPERKASGQANYSPEEFLAYNDFVVKTALGDKFFKVFVTAAETDLTAGFMAGNKQMRAEINKFYEDASLNRLIDQFVADNTEPAKTAKFNAANQLAETFGTLQMEAERGSGSTGRKVEKDQALTESYTELLNEALKQNRELTADQKAFVKINYDKMSDVLGAKQKVLADDFRQNGNLALKKVLAAAFADCLSIDEINGLNSALKTPAGRDLIKYFTYEIESGNPELDKFVKTEAGSRVSAVMTKMISKPMNAATKPLYEKYMEATFKLLEPAELNKLINEFVAANYKK